MEIRHEKSKIFVNDPDPNNYNSNNLIINTYGKNILTYNANSKNEIAIRITTATSIMVILEMIWRSR